jgi:hypothetical protein
MQTARDAAAIAIGLFIIAAVGEPIRYYRSKQMRQETVRFIP